MYLALSSDVGLCSWDSDHVIFGRSLPYLYRCIYLPLDQEYSYLALDLVIYT